MSVPMGVFRVEKDGVGSTARLNPPLQPHPVPTEYRKLLESGVISIRALSYSHVNRKVYGAMRSLHPQTSQSTINHRIINHQTVNHQQPTTDHQESTATNDQTANQPITNHQRPTTTNHQPPIINHHHQPPTTTHQQPTTNHQSLIGGKAV